MRERFSPDTTSLTAAFVRAGFDDADALSRATLTTEATAALTRTAGAAAQWRWFVPGRIELFGKHTDYAGGRSLVAAAPRGFAVAARPRDDGVVRVIDARLGQTVELDPASAAPRAGGWQNYVAVVVSRLARDFAGASFGTDIAIASDLPRAAGLSSSSALIVGVALALIERAGLADHVLWRRTMRSPLEIAGYLAAVESGAGYGPFATTTGVGTHGGSEDHTAILTSCAGHFSQYRYAPTAHLGDVALPSEWRVVIGGTGVAAEKTGAARGHYNRAVARAHALLDLWNRRRSPPAATLAAALASDPNAAAELRRLAVGGGHPALADRLAHFIAEDARIPVAVRALATTDANTLEELASASQDDAERWLGNQIDESRRMAQIARQIGAVAASGFGAGFGGSVWAIVAAAGAADFADEWTAAYRRAFPQHAVIDPFVTRGGPGLLRLPVC